MYRGVVIYFLFAYVFEGLGGKNPWHEIREVMHENDLAQHRIQMEFIAAEYAQWPNHVGMGGFHPWWADFPP